MSEWDDRKLLDSSALRAIIREELEADRQKISAMERKIAQWEAGAFLFRWFVIVTAGTLTAAAGVLDWMKEHLK